MISPTIFKKSGDKKEAEPNCSLDPRLDSSDLQNHLKLQMMSTLLFVGANPGRMGKNPVFVPLGAFARHLFRRFG